MANYKGPVDGSDDDDDDAGKKKKGKTKKKKDPNAPKGPMSSFMCFNVEIRPQLKKDNPDASFGDIVSVSFRIVGLRGQAYYKPHALVLDK